jgi:hypothetical protein
MVSVVAQLWCFQGWPIIFRIVLLMAFDMAEEGYNNVEGVECMDNALDDVPVGIKRNGRVVSQVALVLHYLGQERLAAGVGS